MPHIGIVGAGISGLRCAEVLLKRGFSVTILEARNRLGGRIHQTTLPSGHLVDMGPNWIHGTDHNPILDLAKETGTVTHSWDDRSSMFDEDGNLLPKKDTEEYDDTMWEIITEAFKHSHQNSANISVDKSLFSFFQEKVIEKFPGTEDNFEKKRKILLQICEMWGAFVGSPVYKQSLKFFWLEECIDGGMLRLELAKKNLSKS